MTIAQKAHDEILKHLNAGSITKQYVESKNQYFKQALTHTIFMAEGAYKMGIEKAIRFSEAVKVPKERLETLNMLKDERAYKFLKWIDKETDHNFYIVSIEEGNIGLWKRNLKAVVRLGIFNANKNVERILGSQQKVIEIQDIHSFKKGEGYKIMNRILVFAARHKLPVTLWTETKDNVKYFERYGFINHGRLGKNKEYLMIRH